MRGPRRLARIIFLCEIAARSTVDGRASRHDNAGHLTSGGAPLVSNWGG